MVQLPLDEEKQFQDMFSMYASPGWKSLMASANETAEFLENARHIKSEKELFAAQGKLFVLDWLRRHEEAMRLQYTLLVTADEVSND